ncbi:DUF3486 family protein [Craterilacuibacter sinensis]|uniref:DUF3486 family protein n=1 Tax=Craterilacuibacter sinensis TaxID=2686017 RepID=A0A845BQJ7_9NEIS|nr:DUF3486 family protein [Craterilacuibacter sinensis]MXR36721.1 DUF3486 family protein [Craterilacuibacter sinensis]
MPPRSKVSQLPPEIRDWLDRELVEGEFSGYEALAGVLAEKGFSISRASLQRYGQTFEDRLAALNVATRQARAVVEAAPDNEGAVNEALMRLVQEKLFQLLMAEEGQIDLPKVAKAVAELGKASVVQKKWQAEVRDKARAAADAAETLVSKSGLSGDTVQQIRKMILGIAE